MDAALDILKLFFILVWLLLLPVVLVLATPFVLLWPRRDPAKSYVRTVFRRYLTLVKIWGIFGEATDVGAGDLDTGE